MERHTRRAPVTKMLAATSSATIGSRRWMPVAATGATPAMTPAEVKP